jgi:hypothetical protein
MVAGPKGCWWVARESLDAGQRPTNLYLKIPSGRTNNMRKMVGGGVIVVALVIGLSIAVAKGMLGSNAKAEPVRTPAVTMASSEAASRQPTSSGHGMGLAALERAAQDQKYLFAFFWSTANEQTAAMREVFEQATGKVADRAQAVAVRVSDSAESGIVAKFELSRAPMPLVLAIAPNGAIMGGFPTKCEENDLLNAFGSPCTEKCMKSLQDGKLVLLCVQNSSTQSNEEALQGVNEFKADAKFAGATEVVMLDPTASAEASFLGDLKIDAKTTVAMTAFLAPPGSVIAEYEGATTKDALVAALQQANTGCGPSGCGPSGCAPK